MVEVIDMATGAKVEPAPSDTNKAPPSESPSSTNTKSGGRSASSREIYERAVNEYGKKIVKPQPPELRKDPGPAKSILQQLKERDE